MIRSISLSLSLPSRSVSVLALRVNCVSVSSTPHTTEHTSSNDFAVLWRFVRSHFFLLSCSFLFDSVKIVGTFMPRRTWVLLLLFGGESAKPKIVPCTFVRYETHEASNAERLNAIVASYTHHTAMSVSVIWIRRFLGRRTEPTTLTSAVEKEKRERKKSEMKCKSYTANITPRPNWMANYFILHNSRRTIFPFGQICEIMRL